MSVRKFLCHDIPLHDRHGSMVQLVLPVDLTAREAARLSALLRALICPRYKARVYEVRRVN